MKILIGMIFIYIGTVFERYIGIDNFSMPLSVICFAAGSGLAVLNGFVGMGSLQLQNVILFFADAFLISMAVTGILQYFDNRIVRDLKVLKYFGENTIVVLCTNNILIEAARLIDYKVTGSILLAWGIAGSFLLSFILWIPEAGLIKIANGPLGILFGKRNNTK